jgi:diguanylate cyclase (GGDEF)-like protein
MRINPDDFPGSPYAEELRRGVGGLRFDGELEAEYLRSHLARVRLRLKTWFTVSATMAVFFSIVQVRRTGLASALALLHLGALLPCLFVLAGLVWSRQYERFYLPVARVLVPPGWALISVFVAYHLADNHPEEIAALALNILATFFVGLMFRQALVTCALAILAFASASIVAGVPLALTIKCAAILALTGGVAAAVTWDIEQSYRRSFLEGSLIKYLAARDGLSGLMNRRAFDEHLLRVWQHALRDRRTLSILMVDIDYFKAFNDKFGHQAGDAVLRQVAEVVAGIARRPLDLAARYGGEEFAVILYDLAPAHVHEMAERLRKGVQDLRVVVRQDGQSTSCVVTVSVGVGIALPTIGRTPQGIVQLADESLYEAKQVGRNCVITKGTDAYKLLETGGFKVPTGLGTR